MDKQIPDRVMTPEALTYMHYHEALDRAYSVQYIIQNMLLDHKVFDQNDQLRKKAEKAQELIAEVFQDIANHPDYNISE